MNFEAFANLNFPSGHFIFEIVGVEGKMLDPIGRPALAKAIIEGKRITIQISSDLDEREVGISIYHEVLESLAVALDEPPESVMELNESGFEKLAQEAYLQYGYPTPEIMLSWIKKWDFNLMNIENLKIEMTRLAEGNRLIRLSDATLGICLERKVHQGQSIVKQKNQLVNALVHLIDSKVLAAA
jgi:hypothetical protein